MSARGRGPRLFIRAALALVLVLCHPAQIDSRYWWRSPRFISALGLTADQAARIDGVYRETLPERLKLADQVEGAHARLEHLLESDTRDEEVIQTVIAEEADADAARWSLRTRMLYRMWRVLTPAQRLQLDRLAATQPQTAQLR